MPPAFPEAPGPAPVRSSRRDTVGVRKRARPAREPARILGAPPPAAPGDTEPAEGASSSLLAGYRVVRRLGSSARADVYLGHAGHRDATAPAKGWGRPGSVALKVFGVETDAASIEREIRALTQAPAGRMPELIDVATLPDGRVCLVLERLAGQSLGRYLGSIDRLEPGEAVTILAPVVTALAALHDAGFVHEGLSQSSVLFDERGRPVVTGLGALRDLPAAGAARIAALRANYLRLGVLIRGVLDCLDQRDPCVPAAEELAVWFEDRAADVPFRPCLDELERRLFGWAQPTAVHLPGAGPAATTTPAPGAGRVGFGTDVVARGPQVDASAAQPERRRLPGWFAVFHLPPELQDAVAGALAATPAAAGMKRLRDRARLRRRPVILAALLASALVLPALSLLPESAGSEESTGPEQSTMRQPGTRQPGDPPDAAGRGTDSPAVAAQDAAALDGDEPVLAVPVLLRLRAGCLAAASIVCLDAVEQPGSAVMAADSYGARAAQQGGGTAAAPTFEGYTAGLVERTGNSALVALAPPDGPAGAEGRPASVLVVKGEAGWRLREIFDY